MKAPYEPPITLKQALRLATAKRRLLIKYCKRHSIPVVVFKPVKVTPQDYKGLPQLRRTQ